MVTKLHRGYNYIIVIIWSKYICIVTVNTVLKKIYLKKKIKIWVTYLRWVAASNFYIIFIYSLSSKFIIQCRIWKLVIFPLIHGVYAHRHFYEYFSISRLVWETIQWERHLKEWVRILKILNVIHVLKYHSFLLWGAQG